MPNKTHWKKTPQLALLLGRLANLLLAPVITPVICSKAINYHRLQIGYLKVIFSLLD